MISKQMDRAIQRISSINFNDIKYQDRASYRLLAQEFIRRATIVVHTSSIKALRYPIIQAHDVMGEKLQLDIWSLCPKLEEIDNGYVQMICYFYLEWSTLIDMGNPVAVKNEDLYEPMIKLFERGGSFYIRERELNVGCSGFYIGYVRDEYLNEHFDISDSHLDKIDLEEEMQVKWENEEGPELHTYLDYAQRRITSINLGHVETYKKSHLVLVNEFLRRSAYLKRYLRLNLDSPFFSLTEALGYSPSLNIEEVCPSLKTMENSLIRSICMDYLELSSLVDKKELRARKYYHFYEPLMRLFERGGRIELKNNDLVIGKSIIPLSDWYFNAVTNSSIIDISEKNLDKLDQEV